MPFNGPFPSVSEANDVGRVGYPQDYFGAHSSTFKCPLMSESYSEDPWYTSDNCTHNSPRPTMEGGRMYNARYTPGAAHRPRGLARLATPQTSELFPSSQKQHLPPTMYRTPVSHPSIHTNMSTYPSEMVGLSSHSQNLCSVFEPQHVSAGVKPTRSQDWAALNFGGDILNHGTGVSTYSSASNWPPSNPDISPSGLQSWNEMMLSTMDFGSPTYVMPSLPHCSSSPDSTPSPCPSPPRHYTSRNHSPLFNNLSISASCGAVDRPTKVKVCSHCRATSTPLWRREPHTLRPLCNACGLYLQQRNKHRPQELIDADIEDDSTDGSETNLSGPECSHCHTHQTSVWRRSKTGAQLCNACGVYLRLRGKDRPLSLKRNKIKPRSKHATK